MNCDLIFPGVVLALIGCIALYKAIHEWREAGRGSHLPMSSCGRVAPGLVQIAGRAVAAETMLVSEVLGVPCLLSRLKVERQFKTEKNNNVWREEYSAEQGVPFFVEDESGRVRVDPTNADLELVPDLEFSSVEPTKLSTQTMQHMQEKGMSAEQMHSRLEEISAREFEKKWSTDSPGFLTKLIWLFSGKRYTPRPLSPYLRDMYKEMAKEHAARSALRCKEENLVPGTQVYIVGPAFEAQDPSQGPVLIQRGSLSNPFLIGAGTRKEVRRRMRKDSLQKLGIGLVLAIAGFGMIYYCYRHG